MPGLGAPAYAEPSDEFTWAVQPARAKGGSGRDYFVYTAAPGQRISDKVTITNRSSRELSFRVYATDAFNTQDGSFALLTADRRATGVGSWADFENGSYRVKPGEHLDVPFTLSVPANAGPGDHSGGVIAAVSEQTTDARGQRINVDRRVAARIYLRVDGPVSPALQIDRLSMAHDPSSPASGSLKVTYRVRNTGNVRVTAAARITAEGPFGMSLGKPVSRAIPELLPGNSYTFTERVASVPPAGRLTSTVRLSPADPASGTPLPVRPTTRAATAWAVSWPLTALLGVLLAVAVHVFRRSRRTTR